MSWITVIWSMNAGACLTLAASPVQSQESFETISDLIEKQ
jgi:hypothetical protein